MEENQKKQPAKRIKLVDVVLERKGSQMFEGRREKYRVPGTHTIQTQYRVPGTHTIQTLF